MPLALTLDDRRVLEQLEFRLRTLLPEEYQESYESMEPTPMGAAGLKYDRDGRVAWNEIWTTFCDLAMAGGPPHKGRLLGPATDAEIEARPDAYGYVIDEACRGVEMVTDLPAEPSPELGWLRVTCLNETMAGWLVRAITMENVAARVEGMELDLPVSPAFRLEKEIKNIVTVIAKTCHYWLGHMPRRQQRAIAGVFAKLSEEHPLIAPALVTEPHDAALDALALTVRHHTGLARTDHRYAGWLGLQCPDVASALWMMRAMVAGNVLSRREETTLFVPANPQTDPDGAIAKQLL